MRVSIISISLDAIVNSFLETFFCSLFAWTSFQFVSHLERKEVMELFSQLLHASHLAGLDGYKGSRPRAILL
jgi:hypothetical protein